MRPPRPARIKRKNPARARVFRSSGLDNHRMRPKLYLVPGNINTLTVGSTCQVRISNRRPFIAKRTRGETMARQNFYRSDKKGVPAMKKLIPLILLASVVAQPAGVDLRTVTFPATKTHRLKPAPWWYYPLVRPRTQLLLATLEVTMRPLRSFLLLLAIILGIQGLGHAQTSDERRLSIIKDVMDEFAHVELAPIRERFTAELKDSVSENDLKSARDGLGEAAGAFQPQISQTTRTVQGAAIYVSKSEFEHFKVELNRRI